MNAPWRVAIEDLVRFQRLMSPAQTPPDDLHDWLTTRAAEPPAGPEGRDDDDPICSAIQLHAANQAVIVWVAPEMCVLAEAAWRCAPKLAMRVSEVPWPYGFMVLGSPITVDDGEDVHVVDRVLWGRSRLHGEPCMWSSSVELSRVNGSDAAIYMIPNVVTDGEVAVDDFNRLMMTMWTLAMQRVAVVADGHPARPVRRYLVRLGRSDLGSKLRVITLRRPTVNGNHDATDDCPTVWSHQWLVDGHWREQWYPSADEHRPIWINAHIKGPPDKPLVLNKKLYRWVQ